MTTAFDQAGLDRLVAHVDGAIDAGRFAGGVLLLSAGDETWVHCAGVQDLATGVPMAPNSIFRIASMSKSIAAAATMLLVDDGLLDVDAPVDRWLPELADRQVVRSITGPLNDTVPARRPITTRHLLTLTWGLGYLGAAGENSPLQAAMEAGGVAMGWYPPSLAPDDYLAVIASLPLAHQPGEGWLYHNGYDILPTLLDRITGQTAAVFMQERLFDPLEMTDTSFWLPDAKRDRFTTTYTASESGPVVYDPAIDGFWSQPSNPPIEVVTTATDFLKFARMLLSEGSSPAGQILSRAAVRDMTTDYLSAEIKQAYPLFPGYWDTHGWGYGVAMHTTDPVGPGFSQGTYGWSGGFNTHWQSDPTRDLVGVILFQGETGQDDNGVSIESIWQHVNAAVNT